MKGFEMNAIEHDDFYPELTSDVNHPLNLTHVKAECDGSFTLHRLFYSRKISIEEIEESDYPVYKYRIINH